MKKYRLLYRGDLIAEITDYGRGFVNIIRLAIEIARIEMVEVTEEKPDLKKYWKTIADIPEQEEKRDIEFVCDEQGKIKAIRRVYPPRVHTKSSKYSQAEIDALDSSQP